MTATTLGRVYLLLGGILPGGIDGWVTSFGMLTLRDQLSSVVPFSVYTWGNAGQAWDDMQLLPEGQKRIVIGYSGGALQATVIANQIPLQTIDLMILYDPSPAWEIEEIGANVLSAICYHNNNPMMPSWYGWLGGGRLVSLFPQRVQTIEINGGKGEQHLLVQGDKALHAYTVQAVKGALI